MDILKHSTKYPNFKLGLYIFFFNNQKRKRKRKKEEKGNFCKQLDGIWLTKSHVISSHSFNQIQNELNHKK
jgi:hypothetical protein